MKITFKERYRETYLPFFYQKLRDIPIKLKNTESHHLITNQEQQVVESTGERQLFVISHEKNYFRERHMKHISESPNKTNSFSQRVLKIGKVVNPSKSTGSE